MVTDLLDVISTNLLNARIEILVWELSFWTL